MRRILVGADDQHVCLAIRAWLGAYGFRVSIADGGATRCLRKPFKPTTLLGVIDQCPSEAKSRRRYFSSVVCDPQCDPAAISIQTQKRGRRVHHDTEIAELSKKNVLPRGADMQRILVVDDDPMVCMAIEVYLERHDFQVTIADGGEAGLRALEDTMFDLMIVDIFMPHMRGFESIRIFHERAPTTPLVAMSGYAFANLNSPAPDFLRMALELGASRCLRKPFTPVALLAAINECLAEAKSRFSSVVQLR